MAITVFLDPAQMPARTQEQKVFDDLLALFMQNLPTFGAQFNAGVSSFNAAAAGGAYAIPYTVDLTSSADSDPGNGKLRFDSATQNAASTLRLDLLGVGGTDYTAMIDTFDASTSAVKGAIRIVKQGDASTFLLFDVTARTAPTGYRDISVTPRASSAANPFVNGDAVLLFFQRNGDRGSNGSILLLAQATVGTAVANIDFLTAFSAAYDKYIIEVDGLSVSAANNTLRLRFANGGVVDSSASYGQASASSSNVAANLGLVGLTNGSQPTGYSLTLEVRNANSTGVKSASSRGGGFSSGVYETTTLEVVYVKASAVSGFRLFPDGGGTFTSGTVRVYGVLNN